MVVGSVAFYVSRDKKDELLLEPGTTGNTAGNLYNGGLFCENDGVIYFSNPYDDNALYKMDADGENYEKVCDDDTSYICVAGDKIFYKKFNGVNNKDKLFSRIMYGIVSMNKAASESEIIHNGKIDCMTLCGDYIYYRYYDDETLFSFRKVKVDGSEDVKISDEDYAPVAVYKNEVYFCNEGADNRNIMALNTENDTIRTVLDGNFYMPDFAKGCIYYIDIANKSVLTKMDLSTGEKIVLSQDKVINYNMSEKYGVIFYQVENSKDDHKLRRMRLDGSDQTDIMIGDYSKINITQNYTYFMLGMGDSVKMYRTLTIGAPSAKEYTPEVIKD